MYKPIVITEQEARERFPDAIAAMTVDPEDQIYWLDDKGRLHIDDYIHPAYDDMWDNGEWVAATEIPLEEGFDDVE